MKISCELDKCRDKIPRTTDGHPVVSDHFDAYSRNAIAPDHLLAGLGQYLVETVFLLLPSDHERFNLEIVLCHALRNLGMGSHASLFNTKSKNLNSLSMSTVYSLISVLPSFLRVMKYDQSLPVYNILETFNELLSLTFWWPLPNTDGVNSFLYVHGNQKTYLKDMFHLASSFVKMIDELCTTSSIVLSKLDRPNTHRVIELYASTIPHFSHALFCVNMGFESNHQPLKSALSRNTNSNFHMSAVYHALGRDWFARVCELMAMKSNLSQSNQVAEKDIRRGLRRLFFGANADGLREKENEDLDLIREMDERIDSALRPKLVNRLNSWYFSTLPEWYDGEWTGINLCDAGNDFVSEQSTHSFCSKYSTMFGNDVDNDNQVSFFLNAVFTQKNRFNETKTLCSTQLSPWGRL